MIRQIVWQWVAAGCVGAAIGGCGDPKPAAPIPAQNQSGAQAPATTAGDGAVTGAPASAGTPTATPTAATPRVDERYKDVPQSAEEIKPLLAGATLPTIVLRDAEKQAFDLNAAVTSKPTLLIFFRGGWCPYCNRHLQALQQIEPELVKLGYQIIAVTADKPELLPVDAEKNELSYQLFSDSDMAAAMALGICFHVDEATVEKYRGYKIDLERDSGYSHHLLPVPAAYVLKKDGTIFEEYINPDYRVRADTDVLLAACKAALKPAQGKPGK